MSKNKDKKNQDDAGDKNKIESNFSSADKLGERMKDGNYIIHVHIQSAKNLFLPDQDTFDPFVKINVLGSNKET